MKKKKNSFGLLGKIGSVGLKLIAVLSACLATTLVVYGGYAVWDNVYTSNAAYVTHDLTQFKPVPGENDGEDELTLDKVKEINGDAVAWITFFDTNIDYPVVQGENDLEYANKDIYGKASLTGAIYLSSENNSFSDPYCMVYGHHMDNGAMFGDIDKYSDPAFFEAHKKGILITPEQVYDLEVFACVSTNAYDEMIYGVSNKTEADLPFLMDYIREHASIFESESVSGHDNLVAFSTCADDETYGRNVIFAKKTNHEGPLPDEYEVIEEGRTPLALYTQEKDFWALLNLICMLLTVYAFFPIHRFKDKFRRKKKMEKYNEDVEEAIEQIEEADKIVQFEKEEDVEKELNEKLLFESDKFKRKSRIGTIMELIVSIIAIVVFILTENIFLPMTIIDKWTPLMILILFVCWLIDVLLVRYKEKYPEEELVKVDETEFTD